MTCVDIVLTKDVNDPYDTKEPLPLDHYGYMKPLTKEEMEKEPRFYESGMRGNRRGGGSRFRGPRGGDQRGRGGGMRPPYRFNDEGDVDRPRDRGGKFRANIRGGRGRGGHHRFNEDDEFEIHRPHFTRGRPHHFE